MFQQIKDRLRGAKNLSLPINIWTVQDTFLDAFLLTGHPGSVEAFAAEVELPAEVLPR